MSHCTEIRPDLDAYRAGGLTSLKRARVDAHLDGCAQCAAAVSLAALLEDAARMGSPAHSHARKRKNLAAIQARLAKTPSRRLIDWLLRDSSPAIWWPVVGVGAALLVVVFLWTALLGPSAADDEVALANRSVALPVPLADSQPETPLQPPGWLASPKGVRIKLAQPTKILSRGSEQAPRYSLEQGLALFSYDRQPQQSKLEVDTPQARVIVLGTVFSVHVRDDQCHVTVASGRVRVIELSGREREVSANETLRVGGAVAPASEETLALFAPLLAGHLTATESAPPPEATNEPTKRKASALVAIPLVTGERESSSEARAARASAPGEPATETTDGRLWMALDQARARWRAGHAAVALAQVRRVVREGRGDVYEQALYLAAQIQRSQKDIAGAARTLEQLGRASDSPSATLARLEQSRLLSQLGRKSEAEALLGALKESANDPLVKQQAWFELCALYLAARSIKATEWIDAYVRTYPKSPRAVQLHEASVSYQPGP